MFRVFVDLSRKNRVLINRLCPITRIIRRLKAALLSVSLTLAGILLIMLNAWLRGRPFGVWSWLHDVPLGELGGALFAAGFLGTLVRVHIP